MIEWIKTCECCSNEDNGYFEGTYRDEFDMVMCDECFENTKDGELIYD